MKKILYILNRFNLCNGIVSYSMNYYKKLNKDFKIDFLISGEIEDECYRELISSNGNTIYKIPSIKSNSIFKFNKCVDEFFKKHNDFHIVHCHIANIGLIYLWYAKKYNIKIRILHAHATKSSPNFWHRLRNDMAQPITNSLATEYCACSYMAGKAVFNNRPFKVIHNAIDKNKYEYSKEIREKKRKELNITSQFVIGTVGRIDEQKNPIFIVDTFYEFSKIHSNSILLYVGDGSLLNAVINRVKYFNIQDKVIFLNHREDVNELYQAMDAFLLPSLYEGLPVVGIEAQCAGLPVFTSDTVTKELKISDSIYFLKLNDGADIWAAEIYKHMKDARKKIEDFKKTGYCIDEEAGKLSEFYTELIKKNG